MSLIDQLKAHLKDDANVEEVGKILEGYAKLEPNTVKEYVKNPENKSVYDSLVSTAVASHIEKEKAQRADWEKVKAAELLQQAKDTIAKENQKSPEMLELEQMKKELAAEREAKKLSELKSSLQAMINTEKLPIHNVDPFLNYGEEAPNMLKEYASKTNELINDLVKKQLADKYGSGKMDSGKKTDDTPVSTKDFLDEQFSGTLAGER